MEEEQELVKGSKTLVGSEEVSTKLELTIDEVIEGYVGSLGFSQILHVFLVSLAWIFDSQSTLVTIFSDAQPQAWRCKTELCLRNNSIAKSSGSVCGLDYGTWEWVDGHTSSTIAEWNLICDHRFLAAIPPSLYFLGSLIGSVVYGHLADSWLGRKRTLQLSCMLASITSYATSLSTNLWIYALFRFSNGLARSGIGICCLVLATESVGRKWRGQVGQYGFFFFTIGFLTLPLIAYPTRTSWRDLYKLLSLFPLAYSILLLPFVSESPRWLLIRGRTEEALDVLNKFAKLNGKKNLPKNLSLLNPFEDNENGTNQNSEKGLWTTKWAAYRMIIVMITGFGVGFVYYGIQLNVENLNFNLYISVSLNALMEIPAVLLGSFLLARTNRRLLFSFSCYIAGVSCIICSFYSNKRKSSTSKLDEHIVGENWTQLIIESIGFMAASIAFDVLYVYCVELFPTSVRNLSVSMLRQGLMLGASVSPLLVVFGRLSPSFSFLTFGTSSIVSGLLSIWLPETRNAPLYETLRQQEEIEKFNLVCDDSGLELGK